MNQFTTDAAGFKSNINDEKGRSTYLPAVTTGLDPAFSV
jgi:hypothetical protein